MDNRERIIEEAARLFRVYGIKAVTMDQLATHLGMSKRTIYEIFSDKDELLTGVLKYMAEKQKEMVKKVLDESDNVIAAIFRLLEINRDHFQEMSPAFQADLKKFHQEVLAGKFEKCEMPDHTNTLQVIQRGIKEKLFRKEINPDLVNRSLDIMGRLTFNNDLFPFGQYTRREVISTLTINYLRGIATSEGIDLINKYEKKF